MSSSKIYTKTGDQGQTSLVGGQRVSKANQRIKLYGVVDELNSFVGLAASSLSNKNTHISYTHLPKIQNLLFNIGSNLACLPIDRIKINLPTLLKQDILELETQIDLISKDLKPLKNFILPGGTILSSHLHICRTVTRRLEIEATEFNAQNINDISSEILQYINRLSDFFFVLARLANHEVGVEDRLWEK